MYYITKEIENKMLDTDKVHYEIPEHYPQVTLEADLKDKYDLQKDLLPPKLSILKFKKGSITLDQLKADYFRQLEAIQPQGVFHILKNKVIVCNCEGKHSKSCYSVLLDEFIKPKNFKIELISNKNFFKRKRIEL